MKQFILYLILLCMFAINSPLMAQSKYSKVKIYTDTRGLKELAAAGVAIDHGERKKGVFFISDFSEDELNIIRAKGFKYEILIDNVSEYYKERNQKKSQKANNTESSFTRNAGCMAPPDYSVPVGFHLGSMGGYPTYAEILSDIDSLAIQYPAIFKTKSPINSLVSVEGRPIYWVKISDNPGIDESEPELLYTALHHAREPISVSQMLYYMHYLCENYATNPDVQYIINNTEMYFIPCVNPDGYIYNQTTNPSGGGLWRKNRKNNGDGTFGVDLNRNYGFNWGYDNTGSSPQTNSETYRGTAFFSEPETQMVKAFCEAHDFKLTLNYHTYGNDLIYPWGYEASIYTPDSSVFVEYAGLMTSQSHHAFGTGDQTVGYVTNGDADDWCYGDQVSKPKILSMTPEVGSNSQGFWPQQTDIISLCQDVLTQNLYAAKVITKYARATDREPRYISVLNGFLNYSIQRIGLDSPATYTITIIPLSPQITNVGGSKSYNSLHLLEEVNDSISFTLDASVSSGTTLKYVIQLNNGLYTENDTITKIYGIPAIAFSGNDTTFMGWSGNTWGLSNTVFYSPPSSITDSPNSSYLNNATSYITSNSIDLTDAVSANISFYTRWEIENGYDYTEIMISNDSGASWVSQCGKYTATGNASQDEGQPLYSGFRKNWVKEDINLDDYAGQNIFVRFRLVSDAYVNYDGFYFDDFLVEKITSVVSGMNSKTGQSTTGIHISQNMPNPAHQYTTVNYNIDNKDFKNAYLKIYSIYGHLIKQLYLERSYGNIPLDTDDMAGGMYFYKIEAGGKASIPLKMLIVR